MITAEQAKDHVSQLGLTIRDYAQFAVPGFVLLMGAVLSFNLLLSESSMKSLMTLGEQSAFLVFVSLVVLSYVLGQLLASGTHVIDATTQICFRRRAFNVPFGLRTVPDDYRSLIHSAALEKASREIGIDAGKITDASFDTLMEFMLYRIMTSQVSLFHEIQRHQAILYMRKHMVLAIWSWYPFLRHWSNAMITTSVLLLAAFVFFIGYRRLFRRTFFERLPIGYLSLPESRPEKTDLLVLTHG